MLSVASQVGQAVVGLISINGAPVSSPTLATSQFEVHCDEVRAVRAVLLFG